MKINQYRLASNSIRLLLIVIALTCCLVVLPSTTPGPLSSTTASGPAPLVSTPAVTHAVSTGVNRKLASTLLNAPVAAVITATKVDALQTDVNSNGKADPGDTLMYTVTISNTGAMAATNVNFSDMLEANLTLVPGSVNSSPVAVNDAYPNAIGNTRLTVNAANGVLANDFDPDGTTPTAVPIVNGPTTLGGTVSLAADGSFVYDPPVGVTSTTDTFTYTATDGTKTDTGTVSITLSALVWYVDNTYVGATSDGRSATPFKTLAPVNGAGGVGDVDAPGHIIFVFENGGGAYTGGLELESNQMLIGNGVALVVNAQTLVPAGTKPIITNSAGNGVTLSSGNTVRGLAATTTAAGGASAGIAGSSVGNLNIDTVMATGNPGAAVDIQTAGTLGVTFESLSSTNGTRGVRLTSATGGTFTVTGTTTTTGTTGDGIILTGGNPTVSFTGGVSITTASGRGIVANAAGTVSVGGSSTINATGGAALDLTSENLGTGLNFTSLASTNSTAEGIKTQGCIGNITVTGTTNIQTPATTGIDIQSTFGTSIFGFSATTVNKTASGTGVNLASNGTATVGFTSLNITTGAGAGLVATVSGTVNATSGTISATGGQGVNLDSVTMGLALTSVSSSGSSTEGIRFNSASGSFASPGGSITTSTGIAASINGGAATISYGGSITNASNRSVSITSTTGGSVTFSGNITDTGTGILVQNNNTVATKTITFSGLSKSLNTGTNAAVTLSTNGTANGATINFSNGGLAITTTTGTGFNATGGAVGVNVTGSVNTISSGQGTALNVSSTTIGVSGMTFQSITSNGGTSTGIILDTTGSTGSLTVTGTGTAASGGTIANKAQVGADGGTTNGIGIYLNSTTNPSFTRMQLNDFGNFAIRGTTVSGFTLDNSVISGNSGNNTSGGGSDEAAIRFTDLTGNATISNCTISGGYEFNVNVIVNSGSLNRLNFTNTTVNAMQASGNEDDSFHVEAFNSATLNVTVSDSIFTSAKGDVINIAANQNSTMDLIFRRNKVSNNHANILSGGGGVLIASGGAPGVTASMTYDISCNTFRDAKGTSLDVFKGNGAGNAVGSIINNTIGVTAVNNSGGDTGIRVRSLGTGVHTVLVKNNTINKVINDGMLLRPAEGSSTMNATILGNTINPLSGGTPEAGLFLETGALPGDATTLNVLVGSSSVSADKNALGGTLGTAADVVLLQTFGTFNLSRGGSASATATLVIKDDNTGNPSVLPSGTITLVAGNPTLPPAVATCVQPSFADPGETTQQSLSEQPDSVAGPTDDTLWAEGGQGPGGKSLGKLKKSDLPWIIPAAIERWKAMGISAEDVARLEAVNFDIDDLPDGQLAYTTATQVVIDRRAAGYGWFIDVTPYDETEFETQDGNDLKASEISQAYQRMDLFTVVMHALGFVLDHDKPRAERRQDALTSTSLATGTRRLPETKVSGRNTSTSSGSISTGDALMAFVYVLESLPTLQVGPITSVVEPVGYALSKWTAPTVSTATGKVETAYAVGVADEAIQKNPSVAASGQLSTSNDLRQLSATADATTATRIPDLRPAVFTRPQDVSVMGIRAETVETASFSSAGPSAATGQQQATPNAPAVGSISIGPFTLPPSESVTIMFQATINTPVVPPGTTQVCNQGTVTADGPISVLTDDPDVAGAANPTCTTLAQADLAVTKTDTPDPVFSGSNITYTINTINNGPDTANNAVLTDAIPANTTFVSVTTPAGWTRVDSVPVGGTGTIMFTKPTVANAETASFTLVVNVDNATPGGTIVTNNAVITSDTPDGTQGNNTGTATTTVQAQADLEIVSKTDAPDPVLAGNNITYTISFINNGPGSATSATVTDAVPANTTFVSASVTTGSGWSISAPAVGGTGNVVFSKGSVPNGETATFQVVVKVNSNTANGATITNTATAASSTADPTPGNDSKTATTTVATEADLAVTKTDSPDPVIAGNNITYTINFTNNGPSDAQTVTVTDAVPANTTFVSATVTTGSGWSTSAPAVGGTGNVVFSKGTVAAGETAVFTVVVKVGASTPDATTITNTATAATATTDPTAGNNSATATTTVQTRADLAVTKTDSPDPVTAGQNITYTINFTNNGPSDAQTVTVTDAVPANTTFVSATVTTGSGWSTSAPAVGGTGNVVFSKATVAAGETAVFTVVVKVNATTANGATITNTATAASATTDPTPGNNSATATTTVQTSADLAITKTDSPDPVVAGNNITYTINFTNNGPSDAQTVTVTDAVPANTTFVSATVTTGSGWSTSAPAVGGTGNVVFSKGTVAAGETAVFTVVVNVNSATAGGTVISNTATAASATSDPTPANNFSTATTTVQAVADLAVTKSDSPDPVIAGNNITYTINFANNGPSQATTVAVTDAVPANTTFVSATVTTGSGWSTSAPAVGGTGNVVFSKATVANGETAVFTIVVKVNASTANGSTITNTVTTSATTADTTPGNDSATATTTVQTSADLAVTKTDSPDPVVAGNNITYTINFTNNGPSDAQTVTVTDAVPANTTFVSATVTTGSGWSSSAPGVGGTGNVVFSKSTVSAGETAVFTMVVKVNTSAANGATITNSATAASATSDPTPGNNTGTATTTVQTMADLAVTKTDSPDPVIAGNNITYTINFTNNGPSDAQTVTVTDAVPANTTFVSATVTTGSGWSTSAPAVGGTGNVVFSKGAVSAGETAVFTVVVKVNSTTADGATITNTATAASATTDPTPGNNSATATTTVQMMADIAVVKTDTPDPVVASQNLTYTINFTNNGPSSANSVTVTDAVPANTTFVSATVTTGSGWSTSAPAVGGTGNVVFSKASVGGSETAVFTIVVNVNANTPHNTTLTNTATAASSTTDPTPGNNSSTATTTVLAQADLAVTKSDSPDPVCAGSNITYTINYSNNGPGDGLNVTVTDAVPANATFVSATVTTGSGWSTSAPAVGGTGNVVFSKATSSNGDSATFTVVVNVNSATSGGTTITNSATAASTIMDPTPGNNTGTATTFVNRAPDITQNPQTQTVCAGDKVTFTAAANGTPTPTVQWQVSTDGGGTFNNLSGETSTTLLFTANFSMNGNKYRAVFTNTCGMTPTSAAMLTVNTTPVVLTNPQSVTACVGDVVNFSSTASGSPAPTIQWQVSTDNGATFNNIGGATSNPLTVTATVAVRNNRYRAKFTNTCGMATSQAATLGVDQVPPTITCPANIIITTVNPGDPRVVVNYPPPVTADNCGVASVVCNPPSGSEFPLGSTTVVCTVTDTAGNTATCSFTVSVFDVCLQDNTNGSYIVFNSVTGDYLFVRCSDGFQISGRGSITRSNCNITLTYNQGNQTVQAHINTCTHKGDATLTIVQNKRLTVSSIKDDDTTNSTCSCPPNVVNTDR